MHWNWLRKNTSSASPLALRKASCDAPVQNIALLDGGYFDVLRIRAVPGCRFSREVDTHEDLIGGGAHTVRRLS